MVKSLVTFFDSGMRLVCLDRLICLSVFMCTCHYAGEADSTGQADGRQGRERLYKEGELMLKILFLHAQHSVTIVYETTALIKFCTAHDLSWHSIHTCTCTHIQGSLRLERGNKVGWGLENWFPLPPVNFEHVLCSM